MLTLTAALLGCWVGVMATLYSQQVRRRRRIRRRIDRYSAHGWQEHQAELYATGERLRWFTSS